METVQNTNKFIQRMKFVIKDYASEISILCGLIILCAILSIASPYFLQVQNFLNIGVYISVAGTMAAGLTVVMLMGCMDLSQYSVMAAIGMMVAILLNNGVNAILCIFIAIATGACVGCLNAFAVTKMNIVPMIATIATQLMARAVAFLSTGGKYLNIKNAVFKTIGFGDFLGVPILIWVLIIFNVSLAFILKNTSFGRKVYAVGGNPTACKLSGINVNKMRLVGYIISGASAGIASILSISQVSAALPTAGSGQEMDCVAAVFLGGLSLGGGKGRIVGTFIGVTLIAVLMNGMTLLSLDAYYQIFLKGFVLLLAVYLDQVRQARNRL
ncbi:MAG: ABC transporter permease [Clostridiaceae bacterium]|jgi:ribose transport system permease protein|nr:ABC transporter permease [Clostridiaceae bacterium]